MTTILTLTVALLLPGDPAAPSTTPRKPNPFAPSLPLLAEKEEEELDQIIDRFIDFDTGKLHGEEGKQALAEFRRLGSESIPALIRGMNRAAKIDGSCPALTIAKKLRSLFAASNDRQLMDFARENIGAGITRSRHMSVIKDLKFYCLMRKRAIPEDAVIPAPAPPLVRVSSLRSVSASQLLLEAAGTDGELKRDQLLQELQGRPRDEFLAEVGKVAADADDAKARRLARAELRRYLSRQSSAVVKKLLQHEQVEVRIAAAEVAGTKGYHFESSLIDLLTSDNADLRQTAHKSLVRLSKGTDLGPDDEASAADRAKAARKWREWLANQDSR